MFAFSKDPFKPLTEVERAFAKAKLSLLRLQDEVALRIPVSPKPDRKRSRRQWKPFEDTVNIKGEIYVTLRVAQRMLDRARPALSLYIQRDKWLIAPHPQERRARVYRLVDVEATLQRISKRRRYYYRPRQPACSSEV